jgi:hypothetical protein
MTKEEFYRQGLTALNESGVPFLIGGAWALKCYAGIVRDTKDLDVFIRPRDAHAILEYFSNRGFTTEMTASHWLAKATSGDSLIDFVFGSRNGICVVDDEWFAHAKDGAILDEAVKLVPPEEMIWSKGFIMERDRFDGADIMHLMRACGKDMDWRRLLARFDPHWPVLLSHLILFTFVYPAHADVVPAWLMKELMKRWRKTTVPQNGDAQVCRGTLLSQGQYLCDIEQWGYRDARLSPPGNLTPKEVRES